MIREAQFKRAELYKYLSKAAVSQHPKLLLRDSYRKRRHAATK